MVHGKQLEVILWLSLSGLLVSGSRSISPLLLSLLCMLPPTPVVVRRRPLPHLTLYDQLQVAVASVPDRDMIIVMGDFNAHVGSNFDQWGSVIGPHGPSELNENGEHLLDFCACNNLIVTNTWFQHKPVHQLTWYRNGNRSLGGHLLDYVLINRRFRSCVLDTRVFRSVYLESDH